MKLYYTLRNKLNLLFVPVVLFALASCGSYQYSGYEADGIYGESRPGIWEQADPEANEVKPNNNSTYYKNLFAQQSQMVGEVLDNEVFTDVDSYSSNDGYENYSEVGGDVAYVGGNAPWGEDPDTYSINIINTGFGGFYSPWGWGYGYGWGPGWGGFYDPFWDPFYPGWGPGWGPGWAAGWGYGGFGFGIGYGYPYGYGWGYGGFYSPWRYNHYHYYNDNVAYNRGRRSSQGSYRDRDVNNRRSSYSRSIRDIRTSGSPERTSRVQRGVTDNSRIYTRSTRRTESSRSYDSGRSRSSSPVYQRSTQSSNRSYRSSPTTRSSSSTRSSTTRSSSSSSSRGSGATRSSGGSSRGGGRGGSR
ncbi:hypothetical protein [Gramella sp. MT6]|uniref:hypothetical protein n=1 Tax=Gramella sp. MT6 TaxID=2705471 RepID=UPI00214EDFD8|nr:hypothetical protein [Gramella sp. MT6]